MRANNNPNIIFYHTSAGYLGGYTTFSWNDRYNDSINGAYFIDEQSYVFNLMYGHKFENYSQ